MVLNRPGENDSFRSSDSNNAYDTWRSEARRWSSIYQSGDFCSRCFLSQFYPFHILLSRSFSNRNGLPAACAVVMRLTDWSIPIWPFYHNCSLCFCHWWMPNNLQLRAFGRHSGVVSPFKRTMKSLAILPMLLLLTRWYPLQRTSSHHHISIYIYCFFLLVLFGYFIFYKTKFIDFWFYLC